MAERRSPKPKVGGSRPSAPAKHCLFSLGARRLPIEANRFEANWGNKLRAQATRKAERPKQAGERRNKPTINQPLELRGDEPHAHAAREDRGLMVKIPW